MIEICVEFSFSANILLNDTPSGSIYLMFNVNIYRLRKWLAHLEWREKWDKKTKLSLLKIIEILGKCLFIYDSTIFNRDKMVNK